MSDAVARLNAALEGRYAIERELGEGGMATFYLAAALRRRQRVSAATTRWLILGVASIALGAPLEAQVNQTESAGIACFRIRPAPFCRSYWIVEVQGVFPVASSMQTQFSGGQGAPGIEVDVSADNNLEFNLGHMINASSKVSVGGAVVLGSGSGGVPDGARARVRWWATPGASFELEAGVVRTNLGRGLSPPLVGPSLGARLNLRDAGAVLIRYDRVKVPSDDQWSGGSAWGLSLGASASSGRAVVISGLIGLGLLLLVLTIGPGSR